MINEIKEKVFCRLKEIDLSDMSLDEINKYITVFEHCVNVPEKSYTEYLYDMLNKFSSTDTNPEACSCLK